MASKRGIVSAFENATGIDVPDKIAGISIPDPDVGNIVELVDTLSDAGDLVEKATKAREVVAGGARLAGNCWGIIDTAQDVIDRISADIEPLEPLLRLDVSQIPAAFKLFNKTNLDKSASIVGDVLSLGKLLEKISNVLEGVKNIFTLIMETCGDIVDKVMEFMADVAQAFADALHLESALDGIKGLVESLADIIAELADIDSTLRPMVDAWASASWLEAGTFAMKNFDSVKNAMLRFWPAWETSQAQYQAAREVGLSAHQGAKKTWTTFKDLLHQLCAMFGVDVPGGDDARDSDAQPTIAPRGGFVPDE